MRFVALILKKLLDNKGFSKHYFEFFIDVVTSKKAKITCFSEQRSASQEYLEQFSTLFQCFLGGEVLQINSSSAQLFSLLRTCVSLLFLIVQRLTVNLLL